MSAAADASGRPQLTITKDTTVKLSWGVLIALVTYAGIGTWQFFDLRASERERVNALITNLSMNAAQNTANTSQKLSELVSDLSYTTRTLTGYTSRVDRIDEAMQEIKIIRHRIAQAEHFDASYDRRMQAIEAKLEELHRKHAEHAIVIDYIMRWINPSQDQPKKRNNSVPQFRFGGAPDTPDKQQ